MYLRFNTILKIKDHNFSVSNYLRLVILVGLSVLTLTGCPASHQPVILVSASHLDYPLDAKSKGVEGWVQVQYDVNADGTTSNFSVLDSDPPNIFDAVAIQFVETWKFQPFTIILDTQTISSVIRFQIDPDTEEYIPPTL